MQKVKVRKVSSTRPDTRRDKTETETFTDKTEAFNDETKTETFTDKTETFTDETEISLTRVTRPRPRPSPTRPRPEISNFGLKTKAVSRDLTSLLI